MNLQLKTSKNYIEPYTLVTSTSPSWFEAHAGLFRLLMKEIFDPYALSILSKNEQKIIILSIFKGEDAQDNDFSFGFWEN